MQSGGCCSPQPPGTPQPPQRMPSSKEAPVTEASEQAGPPPAPLRTPIAGATRTPPQLPLPLPDAPVQSQALLRVIAAGAPDEGFRPPAERPRERPRAYTSPRRVETSDPFPVSGPPPSAAEGSFRARVTPMLMIRSDAPCGYVSLTGRGNTLLAAAWQHMNSNGSAAPMLWAETRDLFDAVRHTGGCSAARAKAAVLRAIGFNCDVAAPPVLGDSEAAALVCAAWDLDHSGNTDTSTLRELMLDAVQLDFPRFRPPHHRRPRESPLAPSGSGASDCNTATPRRRGDVASSCRSARDTDRGTLRPCAVTRQTASASHDGEDAATIHLAAVGVSRANGAPVTVCRYHVARRHAAQGIDMGRGEVAVQQSNRVSPPRPVASDPYRQPGLLPIPPPPSVVPAAGQWIGGAGLRPESASPQSAARTLESELSVPGSWGSRDRQVRRTPRQRSSSRGTPHADPATARRQTPRQGRRSPTPHEERAAWRM
eukprot:TRINITY_DN20687_c0_g1_i2.p1 TRINITY_DN20687_c0_g1~~TRINITY_DN20687_c0_g1_i2.p1  ORF type:complete len:484 (+),score=104.02 TRINITY_DN20687_c0_g1_i2:612-2063(+)